jgi:hypothetical protein
MGPSGPSRCFQQRRALLLAQPVYALATRGSDVIAWRDGNFDLDEVDPMMRLITAATTAVSTAD